MHVIFSNLVVCWIISLGLCNHFYGGTITWKPVNPCPVGTPVSIMITQTYTWSYPLMPCTSAMILYNQSVGNYSALATKKLQCINNCVNGSLGYSNVNVIPNCIDSSSALNTSIGQRSDIVNLAPGDDFSVAYQDGPWRTLATSSNANWSLASRITVKPRSDNGLYNSAPLSNVISPIYVSTTKTTTIIIPATDPDGDVVRCRWADLSKGIDECGGVCPPSSLPSGTVLNSNCILSMTTPTNKGWYAISIMVEDFINSTSTTPLSSIPVQFLVQVVSPPSCAYPPQVIANPSPESCTAVRVGYSVDIELIATSSCGANISIVDIFMQAFSGVTGGSLASINSMTFQKNYSWTPTASQIGYQLMCAMAVDSENTQSSQYCLEYYVSPDLLYYCPTTLCVITTTTTTTTVSSTSSTSTTKSTTSSSTSTSSTRTTSTSTTSTTANTTGTSAMPATDSTSSSKSEESDLYKWLIIGSTVGVPLLLLCIGGGCLCWYYCCPCGIGRHQLSDCQGPFELYHFDFNATPEPDTRKYIENNLDTNEDAELDVTNRIAVRRREKEQHLTEQYPIIIFPSQSTSTPERPDRFPEHHRTRPKPNRITVISLPASTSKSRIIDPYTISEYNRMHQPPDYERTVNNVHVRHLRWPQRWIRKGRRQPHFDSID